MLWIVNRFDTHWHRAEGSGQESGCRSFVRDDVSDSWSLFLSSFVKALASYPRNEWLKFRWIMIAQLGPALLSCSPLTFFWRSCGTNMIDMIILTCGKHPSTLHDLFCTMFSLLSGYLMPRDRTTACTEGELLSSYATYRLLIGFWAESMHSLKNRWKLKWKTYKCVIRSIDFGDIPWSLMELTLFHSWMS